MPVAGPPPPPLSSSGGSRLGPPLLERDLDALEREVMPRYLEPFIGIATQMLATAAPASVVVLGSRAGVECPLVADRLPGASLKGLELSDASMRRAATRSTSLAASFEILRGPPTKLPDRSFSHALAIHPMCLRATRRELLVDMRRVLVDGGQGVLSLPLRGSFPEILDMIREYALQKDLPKLGEAVEIGAANRPTPETISDELEAAGFTDVEVDVQLLSVRFESGREFVHHPVFELMVSPDTRAALDMAPAVATDALAYARAAILKYWSEGEFELTVNIGAASGRRN